MMRIKLFALVLLLMTAAVAYRSATDQAMRWWSSSMSRMSCRYFVSRRATLRATRWVRWASESASRFNSE